MRSTVGAGTLFSVALALLLIGMVPTADGQSRYTESGATAKFSIGVGVAPGIAIPIGTLDSLDEAGLGFAIRAGVNMTYPLSTDLAAFLNLGLDSRNIGVKEDTLLDPRMGNVQYFFIQPGFSYSSIGISLNVGLPMSGTEPLPRQPGSNVDLDGTQEVPKDRIEMLLEPRLNGTLVIMDEEAYWLGLDISVGLPINELYKEKWQRLEEVDDGRTLVGSTSPLSAHFGVTLQFGLFDAF